MSGEGRARPRWRTWLAVWALLLVAGACFTCYDVLARYPAGAGPGIGQELEVEIPEGVGPRELSTLLEGKGMISSPGRFRLWLRVDGGLAGIKAGRFSLRDDMTPREIVEALSGGAPYRGVRVTVPEGFHLGRVARAMEEAGIVRADELLAAARDKALLLELGIPGPTAEGFLFPDTYYLRRDHGAANVVRRMHAAFEERLAGLSPPPGTDLARLVTAASIVQAEARVPEEMPIIAGVYENRLRDPAFPSRLLQADPAVAYGCVPGIRPGPLAPSCAGFSGTLARKQLDDPANPYNTYRHAGLPPGPICAPGSRALEAALHPAAVPYLYFVAGVEGRHRFAVTLEEHNANVALFKRGM
jgi:UPF0755 protein